MGRMRPVVTGCNRPKAARDGGRLTTNPGCAMQPVWGAVPYRKRLTGYGQPVPPAVDS